MSTATQIEDQALAKGAWAAFRAAPDARAVRASRFCLRRVFRAGFFAGRAQAAPQALPTIGVMAAALAEAKSECLASDCGKRKPGGECSECDEWNEELAARVLRVLSGEPAKMTATLRGVELSVSA